jgi:hypothetical protein
MSKPPMNLDIPAPVILREPIEIRENENNARTLVSVSDICRDAGVRLRVEDRDAYRPRILLNDVLPTAKAWDGNGRSVLVINQQDVAQDFPSLRVLEILAYGFFDYVARECLCHQGYFDRTQCLPAPEYRPWVA